MMWWYHQTRILGCLLGLAVLVSCSMIDEDLSDCEEIGPQPQPPTPEDTVKEAKLDYELRLVTNMSTEIKTKLSTATDLALAEALRDHLSHIFTDFAHDVDLSFYDTKDDSVRLQHDQHIMDANQASYTLNLPMRQYMHLAVANILDNDIVSLADDGRCHPSKLRQVERDTINSHTTGLFTARQPMEVLEGVDQNFNVRLYMANCAAALVIDPRENKGRDIRVFTTGVATGFNICDSAYHFVDRAPYVRTTRLTEEEKTDKQAFCSVTFPSREPDTKAQGRSRTVIETVEPFIAPEGKESLWEFVVYVMQPDGTITRTVLYVRKPLRAGELLIINGWLRDDGSVDTDDVNTVGVSVMLDWNKKDEEDVPL